MKRIFVCIFISLILQACLISRTARPRITGYVFDAKSKQPINACKVGETLTNTNGFFELEEKRYREFTWIGMEAPPVFILEVVRHAGYTNDTINLFSTFGGGQGKGAHWEIDTVFLKRKQSP